MILTKTMPNTLTIAGSDSGGGAGIQADLKTFSALGCYGSSVITALTAQNTLGVQAVYEVPTEFIIEQLTCVLSDIGSHAIKIGMLHRKEVIIALAQYFAKMAQEMPIVLDTVMVSKNGHLLLEKEAVYHLKEQLLPLATLITPNLYEASILLNTVISTSTDMERAAVALSQHTRAVLIKGGHLAGESCNDCFYDAAYKKIIWFENPRIQTQNTHGTGCSLSAAITAYLAQGLSLSNAVNLANQYVHQAIVKGQDLSIGRGQGPIHHFFAMMHNI